MLSSGWVQSYCGSTLNNSEEVWQKRLAYRQTVYPFYIRPLTSTAVESLQSMIGTSVGQSFVLLQSILLFVSSLLLYRYLRLLNLPHVASVSGVVTVLTLYPIFLMYAEPIHLWDDLWVLLLLSATAIALVKGQRLLSVFYFTLSLFAREQSISFWPIFAGALFFGRQSRLSSLTFAIAPLLIFGAYLFEVWQPVAAERYHLIWSNFVSYERTMDTALSLFGVFGVLWLGWFFRLADSPKSKQIAYLRWSSLFAVVITMVIGLFLALARETRIFLPPLVLILPLSVDWFNEFLHRVFPPKFSYRLIFLGVCIPCIGAGVLFMELVYPVFDYRACPDNTRAIVGLHVGLCIATVVIYILSRTRRIVDQPNQTYR